MRPAAFVDFRCINLDPAPDTTGVHLDAAFGHQLRHVFISQGVLEVPTDALHDHLTGKMAAFEGIGGRDRHAPPRYQTPPANFATEPWFPITMRWTVMNQMAKGLAETVGNDEEQYELRPSVLKDLESLQWYLWHGDVFQALRTLDGLQMDVESAA